MGAVVQVGGLFSTWVPWQPIVSDATSEYRRVVDLVKALEEKGGNPNGGDLAQLTGKIGGIATTQAEDQQREELVQEGIEWGYFLSKGWFNWEHQPGPENVMGHPERVFPTVVKGLPATGVEGVLYLHDKRARGAYLNALTMQKAAAPRRIGYSVEGSVLLRDPQKPKRILKSRVLNVAITAHPVQPDARLEVLARSLTAIGYQTPSTPSLDSLSALVPQSLEGATSLATYGTRGRRIAIPDLARLISQQFPHVSYDRALVLAHEMARSVR